MVVGDELGARVLGVFLLLEEGVDADGDRDRAARCNPSPRLSPGAEGGWCGNRRWRCCATCGRSCSRAPTRAASAPRSLPGEAGLEQRKERGDWEPSKLLDSKKEGVEVLVDASRAPITRPSAIAFSARISDIPLFALDPHTLASLLWVSRGKHRGIV